MVKTIRDTFCLSVSDEIIAAATYFLIDMSGEGGTCGSVVGGFMALDLVFGETRPEEKAQSAECMRYVREAPRQILEREQSGVLPRLTRKSAHILT